MTEDEEELMQLKEIYEELWHDAKTLVKDMKRSILIYLYSALVTFTVALASISYAVVYFMVLLHGDTSVLYYIGAIAETVGSIVIIIFGVILLRWYFKIRKRYSKLTEMEKTIED